MAIEIDKRMIRGPLSFACQYQTLDDKREVYNWLVYNFGGHFPNLYYDVRGTKNDRWSVHDDYSLAIDRTFINPTSTIGAFIVRFKDSQDAASFKLRWW